MSKPGTFTCVQCLGEFPVPPGSSLTAKAEAQGRFGEKFKPEELAVVCGACYHKLLPRVGLRSPVTRNRLWKRQHMRRVKG